MKNAILSLTVAGALALSTTGAAAQSVAVGEHQVEIGLTSQMRAAELFARTPTDLTATCRHRSDQVSGAFGASLLSFGINLLFEEVLEAINRARLARIEALTDSFAGVRNLESLEPPASPVTVPAQLDCIAIDQVESGVDGTVYRSSFVFGLVRVGEAAVALQPLLARVSQTTANARVGRRESRNVNVQVGLNLNAIVGGQCPAGESNCAPGEVVALVAPQFAFRNLEPGVTISCLSIDDPGCARMSGQSAAFPMPRAATPVSVGGLVSITSVTLTDANLRQQMWERHRAALLELLKGAATSLTD